MNDYCDFPRTANVFPQLYDTSQSEKYNLSCLFHWISESLKRRGRLMKPFVCSAPLTQTDQQKITALLQGHTIRIYMFCTFTPGLTNLFFTVGIANYHDKTQRDTHIKVSVATTKRCNTHVGSALDSFTESVQRGS